MRANQIPTKFPEAFGVNAGAGYIRSIPVASQIGITNGAASLNDGFPPLTATPLGSGGSPPSIQDFNGLLFQITAWTNWQNAGGLVTYDSAFSTSVGGYPQGAVVASSTTSGVIWLCLSDNNTSNPDTGGSGWVQVLTSSTVAPLAVAAVSAAKTLVAYTSGTATFTPPTGITHIRYKMWGAGGGGGGTNTTTGGASGGGGGAYSEGVVSVTPGTGIAITVGAGGGAGGGTGASGSGGGTSSIGSIASCAGGQGGTGTTGANAGGVAGALAGTGGQINFAGGPSSAASNLVGGGGAQGGSGGGSAFTGPSNQPQIGSGNGVAGLFPGMGGGGGGGATGLATTAGGAGAAGLIIIEYPS